MAIILILVFVLGYLLIALEHNLHIDKAASALITGTLCWAILVLGWHEAPAHLVDSFNDFLHGHGGHGDSGHGGALKVFFEHRLLHHILLLLVNHTVPRFSDTYGGAYLCRGWLLAAF